MNFNSIFFLLSLSPYKVSIMLVYLSAILLCMGGIRFLGILRVGCSSLSRMCLVISPVWSMDIDNQLKILNLRIKVIFYGFQVNSISIAHVSVLSLQVESRVIRFYAIVFRCFTWATLFAGSSTKGKKHCSDNAFTNDKKIRLFSTGSLQFVATMITIKVVLGYQLEHLG